jgi:hypothetical protein
MKPSRTKNIWNKPVPDVTAARAAAADDPRCKPYFGELTKFRSPAGFNAEIFAREVHSATLTMDFHPYQVALEASSANDLRGQILTAQNQLMVRHQQAQVTINSPFTRWQATLQFDHDGHVETAVAATRDDLLRTLLAWKAETAPEPVGSKPPEQEHLPLWSVKRTEEALAFVQFRDAVPEFRRTARNAMSILHWLTEHKLGITCATLIQAYDFLEDNNCLDRLGDELDEEAEAAAREELEQEDRQ